jgi:hypothetical protein
MSWTDTDFKDFDQDKTQSKKELDFNKKRIASMLKKDRKTIKEIKGNYTFKKRFFLFRWYDILKRKSYFYRNYILYKIFG